MNTNDIAVTSEGLDEIGVFLRVAYPGKSWQQVRLDNTGKHHIIAAVILYEVSLADGNKTYARDVIWHPRVSRENDPSKLRELLLKYPVIPPGSTWLAGVGVDRKRLTQRLMSYEQSRSLTYQEFVISTPIKSIHISLDSAITENGQVIGPQQENIRQWMDDVAKKLKEEEL